MDFDEMWQKMPPMERAGIMIGIIKVLEFEHQLDRKEAEEAIAFCSAGMKYNQPQGLKKVFDMIHTGAVKVNMFTDHMAIYVPKNADALIDTISHLKPAEQFDKLNVIIGKLREMNELTESEANDAYADVMKLYIYNGYSHQSMGTRKMLAALTKIMDKNGKIVID
jgi:hypothetical protein